MARIFNNNAKTIAPMQAIYCFSISFRLHYQTHSVRVSPILSYQERLADQSKTVFQLQAILLQQRPTMAIYRYPYRLQSHKRTLATFR